MVIRFYDFEFNLMHIEPKFVSSSWKVCYNDEGTFEARFSNESEVLSLVAENRYLVAVQGEFAAIITGYDVRKEFTLYGRTCNWILKKRLVLPFETDKKYSGAIASSIVSEAFSDVENFVVSNSANGKSITFAKDDISTVYDAVRDCLEDGGIGHEVSFDTKNKKWIFNTLSSHESDLLLSESLKNASDTAITTDILDLADCGYYKKRSDDETDYPEEYTLFSSGTQKGIYRWEAKLSGSKESEARISLNSKKEKTEHVLSTHGVFYGKDYFLGDIVRVQIVKGILKKTVKKRISGINVKYKSSARLEEPVFEEV